MNKPGRPLGVTLAIVMSVVWFSVLPFMQIGLILLVQQRFQHLDFASTGVEPIAVGGDFLGVPAVTLVIQAILGSLFFGLSIFAWRGRPAWMRLALPLAVVSLTLIILAFTVQQTGVEPDLQAGISSAAGLSGTLLEGQFFGGLLLTVYVGWYLNRGPARAFYRGYYLSRPTAQTTTQQDVDG
ncbi:MAG: hypothetical protein K8I82_16360 [Anaerolineae bacterium]|nr:hypothetical protein [Anaerolineae bacterium]